MKRRATRRKVDRKIFKKTADRTNLINIRTMRGGTRL